MFANVYFISLILLSSLTENILFIRRLNTALDFFIF